MKFIIIFILFNFMLFSFAVAENSEKNSNSMESLEDVTLSCARSMISYDTCSALAGTALFDTVYGVGETLLEALENAKSHCTGKEECKILQCRSANNMGGSQYINHELICDCSYQLSNHICGSVAGKVKSISKTRDHWAELVENMIFLCKNKMRKNNIPDSAIPFLHNCSMLNLEN